MVFWRQKHGEEWFMGMLMAKSHRHDYRGLWPQGGARDVCRLINLMKYFDLPQSQSNSPSELSTLSLVGGLDFLFFHIMGIIIPTDYFSKGLKSTTSSDRKRGAPPEVLKKSSDDGFNHQK